MPTQSRSQRAWFHISDQWQGEDLLIQPRTTFRPDDPADPRDLRPAIHVAPTPAQCVIALGAWMDRFPMRIYKTVAAAKAAPWVFDFSLTAEHRIYEAAKFEFVREIDPDDLIRLGVPALNIYSLKRAARIFTKLENLDILRA